jgi:hypothetical protein
LVGSVTLSFSKQLLHLVIVEQVDRMQTLKTNQTKVIAYNEHNKIKGLFDGSCRTIGFIGSTHRATVSMF